MVVLEVYSRCLKVHYKSRLFSGATFFAVLTTVISIIVPFIFAYSSRGFWIKHDTFYEQPDVKFTGEYLLVAITDNISSPVVCSTFSYFQNHADLDKCSVIKARQVDNNKDGKVDELEFSLIVETLGFRIITFYMILAVDYNLNTVCPLQMQAAATIQHYFNGFSVSEINIVANTKLLQLSSLHCHSKWKNNQYNYSVVQNNPDFYSYSIKNILYNYAKRNVSLQVSNIYTTYKVGSGDSQIAIKLKVQFPEHKIRYTSSFWQVMKWAWMQYLALYIMFKWIIRQIRDYVFGNRLVLFYEISPIKKLR